MPNNPYTQRTDAYEEAFTELYVADTDFEAVDLDMSDADLDKMLISSLEADREHWNQAPWNLQETDVNNTAYFLGDQLNDKDFIKNEVKYKDNRIFSSVRAILSYATGQLAKPDVTPSKGDEIYLKGARDIGSALYQHSADEKVDYKVRAAVLNLITRKRGYLKLRFDPNLGLNGDIVTEIVNPEDIIISRYARYLQNPDKIYHRIRCTVEELCARFPDKAEQIKDAYSIRKGVYSQMSRMVTYFECWFTYTDADGKPKEGVCWFIQEKKLILDKMKNPNWVYFKSQNKEKEANVTSLPPKPFICFNYINTGHSYIDETCLVEQAMPLQIMLNKRLHQIGSNLDYANGRWVADKNAFSQEDARNLINKGSKTVAMVDTVKYPDALQNVAPQQFNPQVENSVYFAQGEVDGMMGTPSVFKGAQPDSKDTLGRDLIVKQQAGALQDDLVRAIGTTMEEYYKLKLQMMRVYYNDDYWFQTKGADGKYEFILLNGNNFDTNVKVGVQVDSTLPLDKAMLRTTAMDLWNAGNAIDIKSLYEFLGMPNPDVLAERYIKSQTDPIGYLRSIELSQIDADAESDIQLLIANKTPEERDDYSMSYFNYFNKVLTSNRFQKLTGKDPKAAERITAFLMAIQHTMMDSLNMQEMLDPAGMVPLPPAQPPQVPGQPQPGQPQDPNMQPNGTPAGGPVVPQAPPAPVVPGMPDGTSPAVPTQ